MQNKNLLLEINSIYQFFERGVGVRFYWCEQSVHKKLNYTGRLETSNFEKARRECYLRMSTLLCKTLEMRIQKNLTFKQLNDLKYTAKLYKGELDPIFGYDYFHTRHPWTSDDDYM